jgi:hypothetical protein
MGAMPVDVQRGHGGMPDMETHRQRRFEMSTSKNAAKTLTAAIAVAFASLAGSAYADASGSAQYQAVHPLGFEIPAPGTAGPLHSAPERFLDPKGVSPLGFEIPAPGARGVQGPVRSDSVADTSAERDLRERLAGIGGWNTP